jgi:hypothetical protein
MANELRPAIGVYTPSEKTQEITETGPPLKLLLALQLEIEILIQANDTYANDLDDITTQIAGLITYTLGNNCKSCIYDGFDVTTFDVGGDKPLLIGKMSYKVEYYATESLTSTGDKLNKIYGDWDTADPSNVGGGPDGQIDAQDRINNLNP